MKVPYIDLPAQYARSRKNTINELEKVLKHGQFILGTEVLKFEKHFANYCGTKYAVGLNSATDGLILTLKALGIGSGDEVITVPNSFIASVAAIVHVGASPLLVDVGEDQNINPQLIEPVITKKTKAIIPVHLTGRSADMSAISQLARKYNLHIIEDAAQAVGAEWRNKRVGFFGIAGCFSLHPLKNLNVIGDGGLVTTNSKRLAERLKLLRNHGLKDRDHVSIWGFNSRLDTLQASVALINLKHLDVINKKKRKIAFFYNQKLASLPIRLPLEKKNQKCVYHTYVIQTDKRNKLKAFLKKSNIETKIHYPVPIHLQKAAKHLGYQKDDFPVAEKQAKEILSLPIYPEISERQINYVVKSIKSFFLINS